MKRSIIDFIIHRDDFHDEVKKSEEYNRVSDERYEIYKKLEKVLSEEQREQFEKFVDMGIDETALSNKDYFKMGVKVGVRLVSECMFD